MNELEAKCYLTKKGGANNSDHTCRPDCKKLMSFSESVATNLLESGVKTRAPNWLFPCVINDNNSM